jgi:hypothetical protein
MMRALMLIGSVIALLIVGMLVINNMGGDMGDGVNDTEAKRVIERAEDTADQVGEKVRDIQKRINSAD